MNQETTNSCPEENIIKEECGVSSQIETKDTRNHNIGNSNYSSMPKGYQPWDLWKIFHMNPFDADILKRLLRTKVEPGMTMAESRKLDYQKIIHICQERINQINEGYEF